jgi:hypothetical protein
MTADGHKPPERETRPFGAEHPDGLFFSNGDEL